MNEDRFDEVIVEIARDYNAPPPVPREEMWEAIQAARAGDSHPRFARRYSAWVGWAVGIAAALMIGIGLGRMSMRPTAAPPVAIAPSVAAPPSLPADAPLPEVRATPGAAGETAYRVVANQHLGQAAMLLTSFRSEARTGDIDGRVGVWAKDLLSTTRLLLDSPAGEDAQLRVLLEDLELVLVQLSQLPADGGTQEAKQEVEMATNAIEQAGVLPKIRTALQGGSAATLSQEEL